MANIQMFEQAKDFTKKLTLWQKILISSILGVVILGATLLFLSGTKVEKSVLFSSLEEKEVGKIVQSLKEKKIDYELKDNGTTILVDKENVYDTRVTLANEGLPETGGVGYELFDKTNLGMSEFVQKLNYRRALEGELARTIGSLDEVKKVRVHIVVPEKALFEKDQKLPTASVTLHLKNDKQISKKSIEGIQNMVSSSVEGMDPSAVNVVDQRGKILSEAPIDENSVAGLTSIQHEQQIKVEQYLTNKIQSLLDGVIGPGNSEVRVNADLDFTKIEQTNTAFNPDEQVVRSEQQIQESNKSTDSLSYPAVNMDKQQSNVITNYEITKKVEHIIQGVGNVKRMTIACLINGTSKIVEKDGTKSLQYVPRQENEMQSLREIIRNAVGYDPARNDQISVLNVPFDTYQDQDLVEEMQRPPWYKEPDNIKLFILIAAMFITLFLIYRILQSKQIKEKLRIAFALPAQVDIDEKDIEEDEDEEEEDTLEEIQLFDDDELLLLPADLPEQLLLESDKDLDQIEDYDEDEDLASGFDKESLAERARAKLDDVETAELTEESLMKIEIKNKVEDYIGSQTQDAVRLVRMFMAQDIDDRAIKF